MSGATYGCSVCRASSQKIIPFGGPRQSAGSVVRFIMSRRSMPKPCSALSCPPTSVSDYGYAGGRHDLLFTTGKILRLCRGGICGECSFSLVHFFAPSKIHRCCWIFPTAPDTVLYRLSARIRRGCIRGCAALCALSTIWLSSRRSRSHRV